MTEVGAFGSKVREDGDTKTEKSRRTLEIPDEVAAALKQHHSVLAR